jgi:pyruvate,water dikinase
VPEDRQRRSSLSERQIHDLAQLGIRIMQLYGRPMDIEWCRVGDELFVVQARPITVAPGCRSCGPGPLERQSGRGFPVDQHQCRRGHPDVMTPATWSMVQVFLSDAMATASHPALHRLRPDRRPDLPQCQRDDEPVRAVGVGEKRFRYLTEEVFGQLPDGVPIPPVLVPRWAVLRSVVPMALHVLGEARR